MVRNNDLVGYACMRCQRYSHFDYSFLRSTVLSMLCPSVTIPRGPFVGCINSRSQCYRVLLHCLPPSLSLFVSLFLFSAFPFSLSLVFFVLVSPIFSQFDSHFSSSLLLLLSLPLPLFFFPILLIFFGFFSCQCVFLLATSLCLSLSPVSSAWNCNRPMNN